jgi:hypothetical protein
VTTTIGSFLASNESQRKLSFTSPSVSVFGLTPRDILHHGLVQSDVVTATATAKPKRSLEEQLFQALANAKIWTSQVAMRLNGATRDRYFAQLDRLHDIDEWFEGDEPIALESYKGFVRLMLIAGGNSKPALALAPSGHLVAVWESSGQRLTIEFRDADRLNWIVNCGDGDRTAGTATLQTILKHLEPYSPNEWFGDG